MKTETWKCDTCGHPIDNVKDGWIEWRSYDDGTQNGLRLVHHNSTGANKGCQYPEGGQNYYLKDLAMSDFTGPYGLMELLSLVHEGKLPKEEVLEMIKRLHIPGYEKARLRIEEAISNEVFQPNSHPGIYTEDQIQLVNEWIDAGN